MKQNTALSPSESESRSPATRRAPLAAAAPISAAESRRQLRYELISGVSGAALAFFMWGHMLLVGTILTGERGFEWVSHGLEKIFVAQPTVVAISLLFFVHAVMASRKIPAQLRERRRMREIAAKLKASPAAPTVEALRFRPHLESMLWIWQVRTGMVVLVLGSFHLGMIAIDLFTGLWGERVGIEASSSMERVGAGMWVMYAVLLVCVEFHASVGLYRLAVKWGFGSRFSRRTLLLAERTVFVVFLGFGLFSLTVLAGWVAPPLEFLVEG